MGDFCYFLVVLTEADSEFQNKLFGDYPNNPYLCSTLTIKRKNMLTKRIILQSSTRILLFFVLLVAPFRLTSDNAKVRIFHGLYKFSAQKPLFFSPYFAPNFAEKLKQRTAVLIITYYLLLFGDFKMQTPKNNYYI